MRDTLRYKQGIESSMLIFKVFFPDLGFFHLGTFAFDSIVISKPPIAINQVGDT